LLPPIALLKNFLDFFGAGNIFAFCLFLFFCCPLLLSSSVILFFRRPK